jgi:hypothetical protein
LGHGYKEKVFPVHTPSIILLPAQCPGRLVGGGSLWPEDSDTGSGQDIIGTAPGKELDPYLSTKVQDGSDHVYLITISLTCLRCGIGKKIA